MAKIVNIEWMQPTRELRCPCCAATVLNADGTPAQELCPHFLFNWQGSVGDFTDVADSVEAVLNDESVDFVGPTDESLIANLPSSATVYHIETRDHACGPVVRTDAIAFDPLAA